MWRTRCDSSNIQRENATHCSGAILSPGIFDYAMFLDTFPCFATSSTDCHFCVLRQWSSQAPTQVRATPRKERTRKACVTGGFRAVPGFNALYGIKYSEWQCFSIWFHCFRFRSKCIGESCVVMHSYCMEHIFVAVEFHIQVNDNYCSRARALDIRIRVTFKESTGDMKFHTHGLPWRRSKAKKPMDVKDCEKVMYTVAINLKKN